MVIFVPDKKITQLTEKIVIDGTEDLIVASNFTNFKVKSQELLDMIQEIPSKASIGLGNVDNTADANKPISTLTQDELDKKAFLLHNHTVTDVDGLVTALAAKMNSSELSNMADIGHIHPLSDVAGFQTILNSKATPAQVATKAEAVHTHSTGEITDLDSTLGSKANLADVNAKALTVHNHAISDISLLQSDLLAKAEPTDLSGKVGSVHTHLIEEVTGLQLALDGKADVGHTHPTIDITGLQTALDSLENEFTLFDSYASIKGPLTVYVGLPATYQITNNDSFNTYNLSASNGSVSAANDVITYTPLIIGTGGFTINGREVVLTVAEPSIATPSILVPVDGAVDLGPNLLITASSFATVPSGFVSHLNTDWELATDIDFTTVVYSSLADNVNLTAITVSLAANTVFYARVRYRSVSSTSAWSPVIDFMSLASYFPTNESAILTASDKAANDNFGYWVAVDGIGTRVVIGADKANPGSLNDAGKAYIFRREETSWIEEAILSASDKSSTAYFGCSVAITELGDRVIIGAYLSNPGGINDAGAAYIFSRSGTVWTQEAIISGSDKAGVDWFGLCVSIDATGTRVIAGAYLADPGGLSAAGKAYIFSRAGTVWAQEAILTASDKATPDRFAYSVAMAGMGDRVAIGAYSAKPGELTDAGKTYVFSRTGTAWTEEAILTASDKAANDQFGIAVAIDNTGTRVVVGSYFGDPGGISNAGKVYIYSRTGTTWVEEAILSASDKASGDVFGYSVSINATGDRVTVGSPNNDPDNLISAGKAYLFTRTNTTWAQEAILTASDKAAGDTFGISIAVSYSGSLIAIGAKAGDPGGIVDAGKVYVFS